MESTLDEEARSATSQAPALLEKLRQTQTSRKGQSFNGLVEAERIVLLLI